MGPSSVAPLCLSPTAAAAAATAAALAPDLTPHSVNASDDVLLSLPPSRFPQVVPDELTPRSPSSTSGPTHGLSNGPISPQSPPTRSHARRATTQDIPPARSPTSVGQPPSIASAHREALEKRDRKHMQLSAATRNKGIDSLRVNSSSIHLTDASPNSHHQRSRSAHKPKHEVTLDFGLDLDGNISYFPDAEEDSGDGTDKSQTAADGGETKENTVFSSFSAHLHLFSYVLLLAGLRQTTSSFYRNWLRVVTNGCAIMCFCNMILQTKSYRNPLFDAALVMLHVLVAVSYEWWLSYCRSKEWKVLMGIVTKVASAHFARHIRLLGWFGLVMVIGATITIVLGWELPIFSQMVEQLNGTINSNTGHQDNFVFLALHGIFMIVIIAPWAAVCMCSVCLFKLVVLAHQSDIEHHFSHLKHTIVQNLEQLQHEYDAMTGTAGMSESRKARAEDQVAAARGQYERRDVISDCFRQIVKHHQAVRGRLRATCQYFNQLYLAYILISTLLVFSAAMDFNHYATAFPFVGDSDGGPAAYTLFPHLVQDVFYMGLGLLGVYGSFYVTCDLSASFERFVRRINDLPIAFPRMSAHIVQISPGTVAGLVSYYQTSKTAYTVYETPVTFGLFVMYTLGVMLVLFFNLWLVNI